LAPLSKTSARQDAVFLVPPLVGGGLLGAHYAQGRTVRDRLTSYITAEVMGISVGGVARR
jgi:hypothetical protein